MDDQDVPQDAREYQETKQNRVYSKISRHGIVIEWELQPNVEAWFASPPLRMLFLCFIRAHTRTGKSRFITQRVYLCWPRSRSIYFSVLPECTCKGRRFRALAPIISGPHMSTTTPSESRAFSHMASLTPIKSLLQLRSQCELMLMQLVLISFVGFWFSPLILIVRGLAASLSWVCLPWAPLEWVDGAE